VPHFNVCKGSVVRMSEIVTNIVLESSNLQVADWYTLVSFRRTAMSPEKQIRVGISYKLHLCEANVRSKTSSFFGIYVSISKQLMAIEPNVT
jgi:hypothetical protein